MRFFCTVGSVNPINEAIAEAVARKGHGARAQLAQAADVGMSTVTRWVNGQIVPTPDKWPAIERSLKMRLGHLRSLHNAAVSRRDDEMNGRVESLEQEVRELRAMTEAMLSRMTDDVRQLVESARTSARARR